MKKVLGELEEEPADSTSSSEFDDSDSTNVRDDLDRSFHDLEVSPLKLHRMNVGQKVLYLKWKSEKTVDSVIDKLAKVANVDKNELKPSTSRCECSDCDRLICLMKEKFRNENLTCHEIVKVLTLVPESWSIAKTAEEFEEFGFTKYMIRQALDLCKQRGLLAQPDKKKGRPLSEDIRFRVVNFLQDDEISRVCPGAKDTVSVRKKGKREIRTKRLLLANMREIYLEYKKRYPDDKIGFSKFCEIRKDDVPECVTVNSSGMHTVCVYQIHQKCFLHFQSNWIIKMLYIKNCL